METTANTPTVYYNAPAPQKGVADTVIKLALVGGLFYVGRKVYREWRSRQTEGKVGSDPNVQFATEIHQAIDGPGTSEKVLFDVVSKITDFAAVTKEYRKLYNASILDDIKGDLSPSDYQKFLNILNLRKVDDKGKPITGKNAIAPGLLVTAEKSVYIRKAPVYIKVLPKILYDTNPLLARNHIALIPPGKHIGVSTGNYSDDTNSPDATRFIEVTVVAITSDTKATLVKLWVASSQVKTKALSKDELKKVLTPTTAFFLSASQYKETLNGVGEAKEVIAKNLITNIYDDKMNFLKFVEHKGLILGNYLGTEKNAAGRELAKYITIQDQVRYTPVEETIIK